MRRRQDGPRPLGDPRGRHAPQDAGVLTSSVALPVPRPLRPARHRTHDGRAFRTLNVLDEFTRESLAIRVCRKLSSVDVIDVLTDLFILRGILGYIRSERIHQRRIARLSAVATASRLPTANRGSPRRLGTAQVRAYLRTGLRLTSWKAGTNLRGYDDLMAKQGNTRDRPNPRHCPSIKLVSLTGRRSFGFHQGQRSAYRNGKAGYMTASSTAVSNRFSPCNTGGVHT